MTPRLLLIDLYCGGGGAAMGYHRAGFDVLGVDCHPQPHYPFAFEQADALDYLREELRMPGGLRAAIVHASAPCQAFTQMSARWRGKGTKADTHPDLLSPTRDLLRESGIDYVLENVIGAKYAMRTDLLLHGGMFGLGVHRPRRFESSVPLSGFHAKRATLPIGVYGTKPDGRTTYRYRNAGNYRIGEPGSAKKSLIRAAKSVEEAQRVMGIDWLPEWRELCEAIPPAYTEFIGQQLLASLSADCPHAAR